MVFLLPESLRPPVIDPVVSDRGRALRIRDYEHATSFTGLSSCTQCGAACLPAATAEELAMALPPVVF